MNRHKLTLFSLLLSLSAPLMGLAAEPVTSTVTLPDMGEAIDSLVSTRQEDQLGLAFMRNVRHSLPLMDDPQITRYINILGQRLATNSSQPQRNFHFFVIDDPAINAFAGPGGYIGINSGLILAAQQEDELASVIAHELAHVTQRHLARAYENTKDMSLPMTAAIIAAIILGNQSGMGQLSEATIASAAAGSIQKQINFTRSNEQEADRIGMQILSRTGYSSDAMQRFFTRLLKNNQYQEDSGLEFLRTHPLTINRIAASNILPLTPATEKQPGNSTTTDYFAVMQHRIRVLVSKNPSQLQAYYDSLTAPDNNAKYGIAVAATKLRHYQQARDLLTTLIHQFPDDLKYSLANIENELASSHTETALSLVEDKLNLYPDDTPLILLYARVLLKDGQAQKARDLLRKHSHKIEATPLFYSLLSEAEGKSGNITATHQALAEYYFLNGDSQAALTQIDLALKQDVTTPANDLARIEARRKVIQETIDLESKL